MTRCAAGLIAAALASALFASPTSAATPAQCRLLVAPLDKLESGVGGFLDSLRDMDMTPVLSEFEGEERAAFEALGTARQEVVPPLERMIFAVQDLQYLMRRCAR